MSNEIVISSSYQKLDLLVGRMEAATIVAKTEMVPTRYQGEPEAIVVAWQAGEEVGLSPMQSLYSFALINNTPALYGDSFIAVVQNCPDYVDMIETFDEKTMTAKCIMKRKGRTDATETFSQKDAELAGLWGKEGPWTQYPKRMLKMRARCFAGRDQFPDALRGIKLVEEVRDYQEIEVQAKVVDDKNADMFAGKKDPEPEEKKEAKKEPKKEADKKPEKEIEAEVVEPEEKPEEKEDVKKEDRKENMTLLEKIFSDTKAVDYAIHRKKLKVGQSVDKLPEVWVKKILSDPAKFNKAVAAWVKENEK